VENGIIRWIGEGKVDPLRHTQYENVDGEDLTLIPGIFDCHEHFAGDGGKNGVSAMEKDSHSREVLLIKAADNARRALMSGQTSARDVGSPYGVSISLARAVAAGALLGPRITASGMWIQMPDTWSGSLVQTVKSAEEMRSVILDQIAQGAGLIKVGATGVREDGTPYGTLGLDVAKMVADLAHQANLKVAAHCFDGYIGAREAVEAGIDSIEHGVCIDTETARLMAQKGTFLVPTMSMWDYIFSAAPRWGSSKNDITKWEAWRDDSEASLKRCLQAGVKIAAGTDAGGSPVRHGTVAKELDVLVRLGLTPKQALESATRLAAELTGTLGEVGTLEIGKLADMVLVDGDPLSDIGALRSLWAVYKGGNRVR
jgi:imidazolonepropionase-like amidohydrolase